MRQPLFFHYVGNIVLNLQRRYDGITRKSTAESLIAEGDFLIYDHDGSKHRRAPPQKRRSPSVTFYGAKPVV